MLGKNNNIFYCIQLKRMIISKLLLMCTLIIKPSRSSRTIPTKFKTHEQAIQTLTKPSFFKHRVLYLDTPNYQTSQDLEISEKEIIWPLKITYVKKHSLKQFPLLPVPPMITKEIWSLKFKKIIGNISTPLIKMNVILKPTGTEIIYLNINSTITSKNIIVPFSNKMIEDDVSKQIELILHQVLKDSGFAS